MDAVNDLADETMLEHRVDCLLRESVNYRVKLDDWAVGGPESSRAFFGSPFAGDEREWQA